MRAMIGGVQLTTMTQGDIVRHLHLMIPSDPDHALWRTRVSNAARRYRKYPARRIARQQG
jgi:hypothetical protein